MSISRFGFVYLLLLWLVAPLALFLIAQKFLRAIKFGPSLIVILNAIIFAALAAVHPLAYMISLPLLSLAVVIANMKSLFRGDRSLEFQAGATIITVVLGIIGFIALTSL